MKKNCNNLSIFPLCKFWNKNALTPPSGEPVDIIFLDPPYDSDLLNESLQLIYSQKESFKNTLVYIEYRKTPDLTNYSILKQAKAGVVKSALIQLAHN